MQTAKKRGDSEGNCQSCRKEGVVERGCRENKRGGSRRAFYTALHASTVVCNDSEQPLATLPLDNLTQLGSTSQCAGTGPLVHRLHSAHCSFRPKLVAGVERTLAFGYGAISAEYRNDKNRLTCVNNREGMPLILNGIQCPFVLAFR